MKKLLFQSSVVMLLLMQLTYAELGASLGVNGTFTDVRTGFDFSLIFSANEDVGTDIGGTTILLFNPPDPNIRTCSTHGSGLGGGVGFPLTTIQCGLSGDIKVAINGCRATVETHGYVHSDFPFTTYSGSSTIEIDFSRRGLTNWVVEITLYTPKESIKLRGTLNGNVVVSTCP
jgi:hypothetical protein